MTRPLFDTLLVDVGRRIRVVATERDDGDMHPFHPDSRIGPWWMLDQVHGVEVRAVPHGEPVARTAGVGDVLVADGTAVTAADGAANTVADPADVSFAVWSADCAPIVLVADDGTVVAAHGGWRGLQQGIVDVAVEAAERNGGDVVSAVLGPVIHPCCYAFERADLESVAGAIDIAPEYVSGHTSSGESALDIPAFVRHALARHGVALDVVGPCTGCDDRWFSHRVRADVGRQATVVTVEAA